MVDRQQNKYSMYCTVRLLLNENKSLWEGRLYFANSVAAFSAVVDAINEANIKQGRKLTGYKKVKHLKRDELEESTLLVVNIMRSYASFIKDKVLSEQMHFMLSQLKNSGGKVIVDTGVIYDLATEHLQGAASFGLTQSLLDDLNEKKLEFQALINRPADQYLAKKEVTAELKELFKKANMILKENLDLDILYFKKD